MSIPNQTKIYQKISQISLKKIIKNDKIVQAENYNIQACLT